MITFFYSVFFSISYLAISREERILQYIKPLGTVNMAEGAAVDPNAKPALAKDAGLKRYKSSCYICHDTGASGAPKLGDKGAWGSRIAKGMDTLHEHAIKGFNAMPAKGGCLNCSDEEIVMTVEYMIQKSK
ncbi:MAG: cytochrome c5 family protein [Gammaproteobacteria bacterium]|nr:cytochrome c5 family protein [Gammaproteobacteria bacterium]